MRRRQRSFEKEHLNLMQRAVDGVFGDGIPSRHTPRFIFTVTLRGPIAIEVEGKNRGGETR